MNVLRDQLNFDALDILAAALGAIAAFSILPVDGDKSTQRIVVCISVFITVAAKRKFVPTLNPNPDSSFQLRFVFMLTALIGACFLGMALIDKLFVLGMFPNSSQRNYAMLFGAVLLALANLIDRRYLKIRDK